MYPITASEKEKSPDEMFHPGYSKPLTESEKSLKLAETVGSVVRKIVEKEEKEKERCASHNDQENSLPPEEEKENPIG